MMAAMAAVRLAHTYELDVATLAAIRRASMRRRCRSPAASTITTGTTPSAASTPSPSRTARSSPTPRSSSAASSHGGRALRTGYVEAVAVRPDRQRRGLGAAVMQALDTGDPWRLRDRRPGGRASDAGRLYVSLGWQRWRGATWALTPHGIERTARRRRQHLRAAARHADRPRRRPRLRLARRRRVVATGSYTCSARC